jgi:probable rRNA maturation factor
MLDLVYENHTNYHALEEEYFRDIFDILIEHFKMSDEQVEIGLQIVEADKMRELNNQYRNKDISTDVLSFPLDESNLKKYGIIALGDIFLCPSYVEQKSKELGIEFKEEIARDIIHGFLHLSGYDHEVSDESEKEMITLQENILKLVTNHK